ncbi:MAG: hypothetical protein AAFY76_01800, partial [Cyanobacteria bacterium J06649_11]
MSREEIIEEGKMSKQVKELKSYFDAKFSALEQGFKSGGTKRKREHEFKYKSNKKQFEFNEDIEEKVKNTIELIKDGSKKRSKRLLEDVLKQKLIRLADKSSGGWATITEYQSDSIASDSANEKKTRAAEKRAIAKINHKKKPAYSTSSTYRRKEMDQGGTSERPIYRSDKRSRAND